MYGMTPVGVFFTAIFPLVINGQALCQQLQFETYFSGPAGQAASRANEKVMLP